MFKKLIYVAVICFLITAAGQSVLADIAQHQVQQTRPIKLGTSGSNMDDNSSSYCCGGTLGSLVSIGSSQYILSNNHVLARSNMASLGEPIIQPGLIDVRCAANPNNTVAYLSDFIQIRFKKGKSAPLNYVDAAIAEVVPGAVDPNGAVLEIGLLGTSTMQASVGQAVKKSGRTTGLTSGTIGSINVTVDVGYSKSCGGAATQIARFTNQILINTAGFSAGGDSGSVIVENVASNPRAVGLLFAGSSKGNTTIANPIGAVLGAFGGTMKSAAVLAPTGTIESSKSQKAREAAIDHAARVKEKHEQAIFEIDGVAGTGIGQSEKGQPVIEIYLSKDRSQVQGKIPAKLDDVPVTVIVTGQFEAF